MIYLIDSISVASPNFNELVPHPQMRTPEIYPQSPLAHTVLSVSGRWSATVSLKCAFCCFGVREQAVADDVEVLCSRQAATTGPSNRIGHLGCEGSQRIIAWRLQWLGLRCGAGTLSLGCGDFRGKRSEAFTNSASRDRPAREEEEARAVTGPSLGSHRLPRPPVSALYKI